MTQNIYARWQMQKIKDALKTRRVVLLEGSRQCGKTTLSKELASNETIYRTLDDSTLLKAAIDDPSGFVRHGNELMIIDEVQRTPDLLLAIKKDVDENQAWGRFLLTGSANIQSLPSVKESLAGRISKVRLRPLTLGEIYGKSPNFITNAFKGEFSISKSSQKPTEGLAYNKDIYISYAMRGGYPEAVKLDQAQEIRRWHKDYLTALIDRDLKDIAEIRRKDSLLKLVEVLAAWSSKELDISKIGTNLSLARPTIETYINALESLYLVERVRPWHTTDYDRIKKQDKIFVTDSGFMSSILKWTFEAVRFDGDLNGKLIETFVFNQLSAILEAQEDDCNLYHYRDREKREIDFIVQNENGDILGIEVKAGSSVNKSMFKHLEWFKHNLAAENKFKGIVLYSGEHALSFGDNMWAVPISSLWS